MANGANNDPFHGLELFDVGVFESPPVSAYEEPAFLPTDPDVPLGGISAPFSSTSDVLRDRAAGIPDVPWTVEEPATTFDWTQLGEFFTKAGQVLKPVAAVGRDVAAIVTGRTPPSVAAQRQNQALAATQAAASRNRWLLLGALGVGMWWLVKR